ncbi:MAG TPA: hypothetical protein VHG92_12540, partial [Afifellaceae bacterium]|nr:hypothetical protein [Afifellaceae bacterium]
QKVADAIYEFYTSKGYEMSRETFQKALAAVEVQPGWPADLEPYMEAHAKVLLDTDKIDSMPDLSKAFRKDFMEQAQQG